MSAPSPLQQLESHNFGALALADFLAFAGGIYEREHDPQAGELDRQYGWMVVSLIRAAVKKRSCYIVAA